MNPAVEPVAWTLERYFSAPDGEDLRLFIETLEADLASLTAAVDDPDRADRALADLLLAHEGIEARIRHLSSYVYCVRSAEPGHAGAEAALTEEVRLAAASEAIGSRLTTALGALSAAGFEALLADPALAGLDWRLSTRRREATSRLTPSEETLAAEMLQDSLHGWSRLADTVFQTLSFDIDPPGEAPIRAAFSERYRYFWSADPSLRRAAYRGYTAGLERVEPVLAACLNGMVGARNTLLRRRGQEVIDEALSRMALERATLEAMMSALHRRRAVLQRYLGLKREALGLPDLAVPDRWAPLGDPDELPAADALDEVCASFDRSFPPLARAARAMRANRWIGFNPSTGAGGAGFCVYSTIVDEPRVYLNVTGSLMGRTVAAHEIGHAFHFMAMDGLRPWSRFVPMTLAETASICAEHLYRSGVLAREDVSARTRLGVLGSDLDAAVNYLLRIPRDFDFERAVYGARAQGELTPAVLKDLARRTHAHWFDGVFAPDGDPLSWTTPLLYSTYSNFFNFPYSFGYLLGRRIAEIVDGRGEAAADAYAAFLRASGSMSAEAAARERLGVDLTDRLFWEAAFDGLERRVEAFAEAAGLANGAGASSSGAAPAEPDPT